MLKTEYVKDFYAFYTEREKFIKERYEEASKLCSTTRELSPDFLLFQQLIDLNSLVVLAIYDDENFVGYCSVSISPALLSKGAVDARLEHLALSKDARSKGLASSIVKKIETFIKENGADELSICLPPTELHESFASKNGYKKSIVIHTKNLGDI